MTALGWCRRLATWLVVGASLAALTAGVLVPRLSGATPYTVLTGSMTPNLPPGTLAVVRPVDPESIATDTVITYQLESGKPTVVTHRVVAVRADLTGQVEYQTRGDANDSPDATWVRPEQVRGELWYAVPYLGHVSTWLSVADRKLLARVLGGLLVAYAALMFAKGLTGRGRTPRGRHVLDKSRVREEVSA